MNLVRGTEKMQEVWVAAAREFTTHLPNAVMNGNGRGEHGYCSVRLVIDGALN